MMSKEELEKRIEELKNDIKILDQFERLEGILSEKEIENITASKQMEKTRLESLLSIFYN